MNLRDDQWFKPNLTTRKRTVSGLLGNFLAENMVPAIMLSFGGGAVRHLLEASSSKPTAPNMSKLVLGIGGAAAGIGGAFQEFLRCPKKMELAMDDLNTQCNSTVRRLEGFMADRSAQLNEIKSSLADTQYRYEHQKTVLFSLSLSLLAIIVALVIVIMYQNTRHEEERHKWTVTQNQQSEKTLQEKLEEQSKRLEEQKEALRIATEEKRLHRHILQSQAPPVHHGQPVVLTLPAGFAQAAGELQGNRG